MLVTRFTQLVGCSVPMQQAGMGGVASPGLAVAVAQAGALGMLGGVTVLTSALGEMLDSMRAQTTGAVGVNFLMPFIDRSAVEVAAAKAKVVEFFYGEPDRALIDAVHTGGALACWQVGSRDEAMAAADAGCDLIVAQGIEAGGHVRGRIGLLALLDQVLPAVRVPVVAAGGIGSGRAMAAALAAGADAVRVGTRFVAAEEADAHPRYVQALIRSDASDTVVTEAFSVNWPNARHRVLRSAVDAATAFEGEVVGEASLGEFLMPLPRFATPSPTRTTTGSIDAMALYAGESVTSVASIQPAKVIVRELADEAERLLRESAARFS